MNKTKTWIWADVLTKCPNCREEIQFRVRGEGNYSTCCEGCGRDVQAHINIEIDDLSSIESDDE